MPAISSGTLSTARSEPLQLPGLPWPVELRVHPSSRRLTLRLDEKRQCLRLTCPRGISRRRALQWAESQRDWVAARLAEHGGSVTLEPGATLLFDGVPRRIESRPDRSRGVEVIEGVIAVGGPEENLGARLGRWLKAESKRRLADETLAIASRAGVTVTAVQVGDAATRWGSCSHDGRIRYNWRLLLAPPEVRSYVVAHEVAHRVHMDHGPAFRALEKELVGADPRPLRLALRRLSPALRRVRLP